MVIESKIRDLYPLSGTKRKSFTRIGYKFGSQAYPCINYRGDIFSLLIAERLQLIRLSQKSQKSCN